jgi:bromodomain-containing factor 1
VTASVISTATPETKKSEETPAPVESQPPATSVTASTPADNTPQPESQPPTNNSTNSPAAPAGVTDIKPVESEDKMAIDSPTTQAAPSTQLPHHPTTTEITTPILPSIQTDHEMKDAPVAPMSPSKLSREREADPAEEPAAKRTRVEGQDAASREYRMAVPPTPATAIPAPVSSNSGGRISKVQQKFIQKSLTTLKRMHDSRFYREAVDWVKLNIPNYPHVITQPMDLSSMEKKLKNNMYSSPQEVFRDFDLMVNNSLVFNGPDHLVYQEGEKLKHTFHKQMTNLPKADEVEERKTKKSTEKTSAARREPRTSLGSTTAKAASPQSTTFALGPEGLPVIRRDSTNPDGRPKRSIHPPKRDLPYATKPKKKKYQWELRFCQEALEELWKPKYSLNAIPFYAPVDPVALNIPTYHSIIKKPMDMTSIKSKLTTGQYENSKEFEADVRLMFKNCYRFNLPGDPTYQCGKALEAVFDLKWAQKQEYLDRHEPHPEHNSDSSDDDSDEEAESDEDDEQLSELQRKIAEMSRQVEMITQKKKKTPPTSKKSGTKTKAVKKESKKTTTKKEKKSSKPAKPEKTRFVSYNEKQIISNGISALPDKKMQQALQIIQSNVPSLKVGIPFLTPPYQFVDFS